MSNEYKWFLKDAVVDKGLCTLCGACAAVCPYEIIEFDENGPRLKEECYRNGEGACKDVCQRVMTDASRISMNVFNFKAKPPSLIGQFERVTSARATNSTIRNKGQDGGAVTALLDYCFDNGLIDGAVNTADFTKPSSRIVTNKEELQESQGSKYSALPVMSALRQVNDELENVAMVGLPCQVYGTRRTQFFKGLNVHPLEIGTDGEKANIPNIPYVIGLFCMENFNYDKLSGYLESIGIDLSKIKKYAIRLDEMIIMTDEGNVEISLKDIEDYVWDGCHICRDAVSKVADISAGHVGSSTGWTTLIARNAKGLELLEAAEKDGYLETSDKVDVEDIEDFANIKMRKFKNELKKRLNDGKEVNFYWVRDYPGVRPEVNGTNFVKIKTNSGIADHEYISKVAELAGKYGDGTLEMTTRKSIEIQGVKGEHIDDLMSEVYESGLKTIGMGYATACPGTAYCPEGIVETKELANKITNQFAQRLTPHKMKVGIAGCPNSCVRAESNDIGIVGQMRPKIDEEKCTGCGRCSELCKLNAISIVAGKAVIDRDLCINCGWCVRGCPHEGAVEDKTGYSIWIGGNDARRPTNGILLKEFCTEDEMVSIIDKLGKVFVKYRTKPGKERLGNIIDLVGEGQFIKEVLSESASNG
ncbi:nitrite and sulphite reductase 4Fe-4S region [Methanohalobium evestigatum Z-7303]|uniref:Nitrite and sulphite reductase 4Fe-4S region n=1 Tax=Methanohalobium evestigatum (strain ATCC BAA-1072 / DSM 3721 / NBRC 107634 / OCM 161 / Z-7303) TaxID=644295 RepID=D7E7J0_METEZ|nr:Coenzyme F420 hydrogenase/dehydrogenase, beta subunit C-terminal domain [Methanohalobium evestigatum]ADI74063.1 nitrite and sulphite reductase 4Fe-4S region [Methanohalobium evestigatum Z-7303]